MSGLRLFTYLFHLVMVVLMLENFHDILGRAGHRLLELLPVSVLLLLQALSVPPVEFDRASSKYFGRVLSLFARPHPNSRGQTGE